MLLNFAKKGVQTLLVTPEMATAWLDRNRRNRKLSERTVLKYAQSMERGEWRGDIGEPIAFTVEGEPLNGQHRLEAVKLLGKPVALLITTGVPESARPFFDGGLVRTAYQNLGMMGDVVCPKHVTTMTNFIFELLGGPKNAGLSAPQIKPIYEELIATFSWAHQFYGNRLFVKAVLGGPFVLAYRADPLKVDDFVRKFISGESLVKDSPPYALRRYYLELGGQSMKERRPVGMKALRAVWAHVCGETRLPKLYETEASIEWVLKAYPEDHVFRAFRAAVLAKRAL